MATRTNWLAAAGEARERILGSLPLGMRRCFMTGKHCISHSGLEGSSKCGEEPMVFVVMPFRPQLDAFFDWCLKPLLIRSGVPEGQIQRADQISRTGYVMCGSICRRIQQAKAVVIDLSTENANVYYELGLAIGLGKPLLVTIDEDTGRQNVVGAWLPIPSDCILTYRGLCSLDRYASGLLDKTCIVPLHPLGRSMRLVPLTVCDPEDQRTGAQGQGKKGIEDIPARFADALDGAMRVAVRSIADPPARNGGCPEMSARTIIAGLDPEERREFKECRYPIGMREKGGKPKPFDSLVKDVDPAFACVVDLADEDELAYFWLGYCHARGINVIPLVRRREDHGMAPPKGKPAAAENKHEGTPERDALDKLLARIAVQLESRQQGTPEPILAFDIRALWYMKFESGNTKQLARLLQSVIEQVVVRDVPTRHRRAFWERLTRKGSLHIYTGAFHHPALSREMVGDWDLRAVSELVRYLSSAEESVVAELETPVYAPEAIASKLKTMGAKPKRASRTTDPRKDELTEQQRMAYIDLLKRELSDKNCLIVASAESNPYTEVVLAYAYAARTSDKDEAGAVCFTEPRDVESNWIVALKGQSPKSTEEQRRPRCFSRPVVAGHPAPGRRGYIFDANRVVEEEYHAQDQTSEPFSMPAHFLITYNPFSRSGEKGRRDHLIVVLNGVSGPGTFAMAQVFTGGITAATAAESERTLKILNKLWDDNSHRSQGVEGLLEVEISPRRFTNPGKTESHDNSIRKEVEGKFFDNREVKKWGLLQDRRFPQNPRCLT